MNSQWLRHTVGTCKPGIDNYVKNVILMDMDRDGKLDVVARSSKIVTIYFQTAADTWKAKRSPLINTRGSGWVTSTAMGIPTLQSMAAGTRPRLMQGMAVTRLAFTLTNGYRPANHRPGLGPWWLQSGGRRPRWEWQERYRCHTSRGHGGDLPCGLVLDK